MGLQAVLVFVNTLELETGADELSSWLEERGVRPTRAALARAREVREALRELLLAHNGLDADVEGASAVLDAASRRARLALRVRGGALVLEPAARGVDRIVGEVLAAVSAAVADGTWRRAKACRAPDCAWAFFDHARNRSRTWCSMEVCGNRAKARRYRARHGSRRPPRAGAE
jgi:predicted RNA-binding Zn ribbon-like protein